MAKMNALQALEDWKNSDKAHSVEINIDNGYGVSCWEVNLYINTKKIQTTEVEIMLKDEEKYEYDWPGLEETIIEAVKKVKWL